MTDEKLELTGADVARACSQQLSPYDCERLSRMPYPQAIDRAFMLLYDAGVEFPNRYLEEKGIG